MAQKQTGITANTRGILDALHYTSGEVEVINDDQYMNGCALRTYDVDQRMFSTGYLPKGALEGNVVIKIYWETDSSTTDVVAYLNIIDNDGNYYEVNVPTRTSTLTAGTRITYNFDSTKSYNIEFKTTEELPLGKYVILNYLRIDQLHTTASLDATLYSDTSTTEPISLTQHGYFHVSPISGDTWISTVVFPIAYDDGVSPKVNITIGNNPYGKRAATFDVVALEGLFAMNYYWTDGTPTTSSPIPFYWTAIGNKTPPISEDDRWTFVG